METPSSRVLESWRQQAADECRYEFFRSRYITGLAVDEETLVTISGDIGRRIWLTEGTEMLWD